MREAFPDDSASRYLIFDRAANFDEETVSTIKSFVIEPKRTTFRSPWQNGIAERFVGNLPARPARSCGRAQRAASQAADD